MIACAPLSPLSIHNHRPVWPPPARAEPDDVSGAGGRGDRLPACRVRSRRRRRPRGEGGRPRSAAGRWRPMTRWAAGCSASGFRTAGSHNGWASNPDRRTSARRPTRAPTAATVSPSLRLPTAPQCASRACTTSSSATAVRSSAMPCSTSPAPPPASTTLASTSSIAGAAYGAIVLRPRAALHVGHAQCHGRREPMYRRAGFASLGLGMTWWMFPDAARP